MKKIIGILFTFIIILALSTQASFAFQLYYDGEVFEYTAAPITLIANGKNIDFDVPPVILNDRTLVPIRAISESMGAMVDWNQENRQVTIMYSGKTIVLTINKSSYTIDGKDYQIKNPDPPPKIINNRTMVPIRFVAEAFGFTVDWNDQTRTVTISKPFAVINSIKLSEEEDSDIVEISSILELGSPTIFRLSNPERVVFDFAGAKFSSKDSQLDRSGAVVENVRYATHENFARIVLDVSEQPELVIIKSNDKLIIKASLPTYRNVLYDGSSGVKLILSGRLNVRSKSQDGKTFTFTVKSTDFGEGTIDVDDNYVKNIKISKNTDGSSTTFTINSKSELEYTVSYSGDNTIISALTGGSDIPYDLEMETLDQVAKDMLVVLDAGHGGNDPGTSYTLEDGTVVNEKDITLDITLKVYQYLKNSGAKLMLTRSDDNYPTLPERTKLANSNDAQLFVSIHVNSMPDNDEINGAMVFYNPNGNYEGYHTTSANVAMIIQSEIIAWTRLADKGIRDGSGLFVIKNSKMPAVLIETAFLSNPNDRVLLLDSSFRTTMAKAIANGIIKALNSCVK